MWWCDRHLATSLITSSQPLMLLLAAAVYDLPTGTVSLCLSVDSARMAVGRLAIYAGPTVWKSLPDELRNSGSFDTFKRFMKTILFSRY